MKWNHKIGTLTVLLALGITMAGCGTPGSTAWKRGGFHDKHDLFGGAKNGSTANARRFTE